MAYGKNVYQQVKKMSTDGKDKHVQEMSTWNKYINTISLDDMSIYKMSVDEMTCCQKRDVKASLN